MQILVDTHALLWWLSDSGSLSKVARDTLSDGKNDLYFSAASVWEISIKEQLGKIKIPKNFLAAVESQGIFQLDITWEHAFSVKTLPQIHQDPFDRLLIAQARAERLCILTKDESIAQYPVETLW